MTPPVDAPDPDSAGTGSGRTGPEPGAADPLSLRGVVPPTITAFDADGDVDREATAAHAAFVADHGVHGVFPLGTNGEQPLLSPDEQAGVVEAVVETVGDDLPVIAGVGAPSTRATVAAAQRAESAGADGVVVVTPYYYPADGEAVVGHYRAVADAVGVPVYVYHIPGRTGNALSHDTLAALADIDGIAGLKDSSKDVPWLGQAVARAPNLTYLVGSDSLLYPGLALGCAGVVSAVANVFPELVVELFEAFDRGDDARAKELQETVYRVRSALKRGPYMAGVKAALSLRDVDFEPGPLRSPLRGMDDGERDALARELADLGLL